MRKFYVFIVCLVLFQCKPKELSLEELKAFVQDEENGLMQSAEVSGTKVSVAYRPTDLWVEQEIGRSSNAQTLDSLRKKYSNYYYFILSVSRDNEEALHSVGNMEAYSQLVETMSFDMAEYVRLTTAHRDTISVGDFMMNRTYGLGFSSDILFAFSNEKAKDSQWIQFNLDEFGLGFGDQQFRFSRKDLEEVPQLNFNLTN